MRRQQSNKPMRRCIGCYSSYPQETLLRFTVKDGDISANKQEGRGFYLCNKRECFERALKKKAFNRVLKRNVNPEELEKLTEELFR